MMSEGGSTVLLTIQKQGVATADHPMEERENMVVSKPRQGPIDSPMEESSTDDLSKDIQALADLRHLPPLFTSPSYYWTCLNTFMDLCPNADKQNLLYLSCKVRNCLISAATASIIHGCPLRVLSILGREADFDVWFVHNLMMYHSTGLGITIYYDVVRPNHPQNASNQSTDSPLSGLFIHVGNCQNFEPTERYDIVLLSHSLNDVPPACLTTIFDEALVSRDHAFMIVIEGTPNEAPKADIGDWVMLERHGGYLENKLACLDPDDSMYEIISVDCWMDVEKVCREAENLDVDLLSFCMGKDLRSLQLDILAMIQEELTVHILFRRCESPARNSSSFAVVSRMCNVLSLAS